MNQTKHSQTQMFRLRQLLIVPFVLAFLATGGLNIAWAQEVSKPIIAILDRDQVFLKSKVGKNAIATVRQRMARRSVDASQASRRSAASPPNPMARSI